MDIRNKFGFLVNLSERLALSQAETAAAGGRLVSSDCGDLGDRVNTHGDWVCFYRDEIIYINLKWYEIMDCCEIMAIWLIHVFKSTSNQDFVPHVSGGFWIILRCFVHTIWLSTSPPFGCGKRNCIRWIRWSMFQNGLKQRTKKNNKPTSNPKTKPTEPTHKAKQTSHGFKSNQDLDNPKNMTWGDTLPWAARALVG